MTNEEIRQIIFSSEKNLLFRLRLEAFVLWIFTGFFLISGAISQYFVTWYAGLLICSGIVFFVWALLVLERTQKRIQEFEAFKSLSLWRRIHQGKHFGTPIKGLALGLRDIVEEIYSTEAGEYLLPLPQAVRLFDIYVRQQRQLNPLNSRLTSLYGLRQPFVTKSAQLQALGEAHMKSPQEQQLDTQIERVEDAHYQISCSCNRLERLIESRPLA